MQGVGGQVLLALLVPIAFLAALLYAYFPSLISWVQGMMRDAPIEEDEETRRRRARMENDNICSICLAEPKRLPLSATCGHSFCGDCLCQLITAENRQLNCPLCRQPITTIFKIFLDVVPEAEVQQIITTIHRYNRAYDDNRPFLRKIYQLPYVLKRLWKFIFSVNFLVFFLVNVKFIYAILTIIAYVLSPFDIFPQAILGFIGYIDDLLFTIIVFFFVFAIIALQFNRLRH